MTNVRCAWLVLIVASPSALGCRLGDGEGRVYSEQLVARDCWNDEYDMQPDFFAADPFRDTMTIRVQRGSEVQERSDGLAVLIDDVPSVRESLGTPIPVTLPPGVAPPGVAVGQQCQGRSCEVSPIHMALYLQESCHNQNTVLYGVGGTITFTEIFSGDPNEEDAAEKRTEAEFDVMVGDPRDAEISNGQSGPIENQSHLVGHFSFFFERGQPAQPFP